MTQGPSFAAGCLLTAGFLLQSQQRASTYPPEVATVFVCWSRPQHLRLVRMSSSSRGGSESPKERVSKSVYRHPQEPLWFEESKVCDYMPITDRMCRLVWQCRLRAIGLMLSMRAGIPADMQSQLRVSRLGRVIRATLCITMYNVRRAPASWRVSGHGMLRCCLHRRMPANFNCLSKQSLVTLHSWRRAVSLGRR
jgi:hypothetical protein